MSRFLLISFLISCSCLTSTAQKQSYRNHPDFKVDSTSTTSYKYLYYQTRVPLLMDWIDEQVSYINDTCYTSTLLKIYNELAALKAKNVNYASISEQILLFERKANEEYEEHKSCYLWYALIRKHLLNKNTNEAENLMLESIKLAGESRYVESKELLLKSYQMDSTNACVNILLFENECFYNSYNVKALVYIDKVISITNGDPIFNLQPYIEKSMVFYENENYASALDNINMHLSKYPTSVEGLNVRAYICSETKNYQDAIADYFKILANINTYNGYYRLDSADVLNSLAWNYYLMKDYPKCIQYAEQSLKLKPKEVEVIHTLASGYYGMGEYEKCIFEMTEALKSDVGYEELWFLRGQCYEKQHKDHLACHDYRKAYLLGYEEALEPMKAICGNSVNEEWVNKQKFTPKPYEMKKYRRMVDLKGFGL